MREVTCDDSFASCLASILELDVEQLPAGPEPDWRRWLGGLGLGLVGVPDAPAFQWAGPWIGWAQPAGGGAPEAVVMFGVPVGVLWDPAGITEADGWRLVDGAVVAALDIALARPVLPTAPTAVGRVEAIHVAPAAGAPAEAVERVRALAGHGLEGDRHVVGAGTFPSGVPGSALTLIEAEVCESFDPPLTGSEHRRNVVTRGIELNALIGHEFSIGELRCRATRLCEPCTMVQRYAGRPVLRPLVHRAGIRADILADGELRAGDRVSAAD